MNKDIKKLLLLSLILLVLSSIFILVMGRTITLSYDLKDNCNYSINSETGRIKVLRKTIKNNKCLIKVKAVKPGTVFIGLNNKQYSEEKMIYIHKNKVITEQQYLGYSTGAEIIPISLVIFLLYSLYLLIKKYKNGIKTKFYSYSNVAYLGIIIFISFFASFNIISIFNYQGLYGTVDEIIRSMSTISFFLFPIALITFILVTISNIVLILREGKSLRNLLGIFLGIFICFLTLLPEISYRIILKTQVINIYNLNSIGPYLYNFIETLVYLIVVYLECLLLATIILAVKAVKRKVPYDKDYLIILGCKIKSDGSLTPLLRGRVDRALEFRNEQLKENGKDLTFIPSGGKGTDEVISEAEAIKNYLVDQGIKNKNILIEDKSTNTYENIMFSSKIINNKKKKVAFSTTNYHVFRAGLLATSLGLKYDGIGSKTRTYYWINAFIREFIGTIYSEKKKHVVVFVLILIFIIVMIQISYLANNL